MRDTLICTVGTSLLRGNISGLSENTKNKPDNWEAISKAFNESKFKQIAVELLKLKPSERVCGAEINTIEEVRKKKWLDLSNLFFLVSDTDDGKNTGKIFEEYFSGRKDLKIKTLEIVTVKKLQDKNPQDFKLFGLRELVKEVGNIIQRIGRERIAIDATGGYKAQIAIAVLIGQALDIPVYYKHEFFSEIIEFPPMPVSLDFELLGKNADLLIALEKDKDYIPVEVYQDNDPKLEVLINKVEIDKIVYLTLSPIGQIYLSGYRIRNPKPVALVKSTNKSEPSFRDDHYPLEFKSFVNKVWKENEWINKCYSLPYSMQKSIKGVGFKVIQEDKTNKLIGTYLDKNGFGARFGILLTDESIQALTWAADYLNTKYDI